MLDCVVCPREAASLGPPSPGPIGDDEFICRASFRPMHIRKGQVTAAIFRKKDLANDELTVWRLADTGLGNVSMLLQKLVTPEKNSINAVHAVKAIEVREIKALKSSRAFSVVDDTIIDSNGNRDPQHASIAPCRSLRDETGELDEIILIDLINKLYLTYRNRLVWP